MELDAQFTAHGLAFVRTCGACPEQYDVYDGRGSQVGYVRLRWGVLEAEFEECGGPTIYTHAFTDDGDMFKGAFDSQEEREYHLNQIALALRQTIDSNEKVL